MADITITINTDNDAFRDDPGCEVARILRKLADDIYNFGIGTKVITDVNGNLVGGIEVEE